MSQSHELFQILADIDDSEQPSTAQSWILPKNEYNITESLPHTIFFIRHALMDSDILAPPGKMLHCPGAGLGWVKAISAGP